MDVKYGTVADWVSGVGTIGAVVWAVRSFKMQLVHRDREAQHKAERAATARAAAVRVVLSPTTFVALGPADDAEGRLAREWCDEIAKRGYVRHQQSWSLGGDTWAVDDLVSEKPAMLDRPWVVAAEVVNGGLQPALVRCVTRDGGVTAWLMPFERKTVRVAGRFATRDEAASAMGDHRRWQIVVEGDDVVALPNVDEERSR